MLYSIQTSSGEITISENQRKALNTKLCEINTETEPDDQLLNVYRQLQRESMEYYKGLYEKMKQCRADIGSSPCVFVSNELFFGKDYVLPLEYPNFIPPAPKNVLYCINFLSETIVKYLQNRIPAVGDRYSSKVLRSTFERKNETGNYSFRNVSFYRVGEKLVQVYTKSSYFEESDSALSWMLHQQPEAQPKWTYRFGIGRDVS